MRVLSMLGLKAFTGILAISSAMAASLAHAGTIGPELGNVLATSRSGDQVDVIIEFVDKFSYQELKGTKVE
jgi:hypothetical protein